MDFDEYEYLEKTVESADVLKTSNGSEAKNREKRRSGGVAEVTEDGYKSKQHRSRDEDREKKSERSLDGRDGSHREKSRDQESDRRRDRSYRDPGREHRDGERRRHSRDHDRDREHVKEQVELHPRKDGSQSRSREHERPDKESSRPRDFGRDHDRHDQESNRPRDFGRDRRYPREKREKKEEGAEQEADPERDQRTVFAFQVSLKADERDVYEFFSQAGKVRDVRLINDRITRRSKGVGYIEFYDAMSVPMAISLTGQLLCGQPVMVKPSEAEKNLVPSTATATSGAGGGIGPYSGSARRLYVGNLHFNIGEEQLRQVFDPFGPIELVQLPMDTDTGHHKGYGFVQYTKLEDARSATALNETLELAGRVIKVVPMTDQGSMPDSVMAQGELDDDDGGGLSLTARSRTLLMQKLDRSGTVQSIVSTATQAAPFNMMSGAATPSVAPVVPGLHLPGMIGLPTAGLGASSTLNATPTEPIGLPSECLLLRNMFDPSTETDPDFDADIKEEVQSECANYGAIKHVFVDKNSAGHVYLRFSTLSAAMNAQRSLHGRWFAGKMITTSYMTIQAYVEKFPDST